MRADNSQHLVAAARQRSESARRRAETVLEEVKQAAVPVTVTRFVRSANVSRSWLYAQPDLLEQVRATLQRPRPETPAAHRASDPSLLRRLELAHERISHLNQENQQLREQLAAAYGRQRAARGNGVVDA